MLSDILPLEVCGSYQSINNLAWGTGPMLGTASGGWLADVVGWRWEPGPQEPFGVFCIVVLFLTISRPKATCTVAKSGSPASSSSRSSSSSIPALRDRFKDFDLAGSVCLTSSLIFLILGMNLGGNVLEWSDSRVIGSLLLGLFLGQLLLHIEMRALLPVTPLRLLWSAPRGLLIFNVCNMIVVNAVRNVPPE